MTVFFMAVFCIAAQPCGDAALTISRTEYVSRSECYRDAILEWGEDREHFAVCFAGRAGENLTP